MKTCNTISNLSLGRNWLILLILCNQKNATLQDVEIWVDIEKCKSNQAPSILKLEHSPFILKHNEGYKK